MTASSHESPIPFTGFPPSGHMNCPQCKYMLKGLPSPHACPECGLEFDNDTYVFIDKTPDPESSPFMVLLVEMSPYLLLVLIALWFVDVMKFAIAILILMLLFAVIVKREWRFLNSPRLVVVGPERLSYRDPGGEMVHLPWTAIQRVSVQRPFGFRKRIEIRPTDGPAQSIKFPRRSKDNKIDGAADAANRRLMQDTQRASSDPSLHG